MKARDPIDMIRSWSLAGFYAALVLFMVVLAGGAYNLRGHLISAGHAPFWIYSLVGLALVTALLCAGAARKGFAAAYRRQPTPPPAMIALALVAAVMVIATSLFKGF